MFVSANKALLGWIFKATTHEPQKGSIQRLNSTVFIRFLISGTSFVLIPWHFIGGTNLTSIVWDKHAPNYTLFKRTSTNSIAAAVEQPPPIWQRPVRGPGDVKGHGQTDLYARIEIIVKRIKKCYNGTQISALYQFSFFHRNLAGGLFSSP